MGLGMVGFIAVERTTGNVALAVLTALAVGALAGLLNGVFVTLIGIPALVVTIGTLFLYRGLTLALVNGRSFALVEARTRKCPRSSSDGFLGSRCSSCGWSWWRSGRGCCSTGIASGRTAT
jgi:ribose/xylose/arabinose/galactoside ABC-type transport system permease subunit